MAGEIQNFLAFLSGFTKIDFTGKEAELGSLVQKYDKDKNSIFDSEELEAIKNDFSVFENNDSHDENVERVQTLLTFGNGNVQFSIDDIRQLASLSEDKLEQAKQLFNIKGRKEQFSVHDRRMLLELSDEEFERAKRLFTYENRGEQISGYGVAVWAKLNDDELKKAKKLINDEEVYKRFYWGNFYGEIACLATLSDEEIKRARQLFYVKNGNNNFDAFEMAELVKLDDEELQWLLKYCDRGIRFKEYILMAKNHCKELEEYIDSNPMALPIYHHGEGVKLRVYRDDNTEKYNVYDKTGIVETITSGRIPESETIESGRITTCYNKKLRIEQVITKGNVPNKDDKDVVFSEVIRQFDNEGNIIKTTTLKRNPDNGTLNVSETDKNGKQTPIQWESTDPDTGASITERHLTSPDGTKTDYYSEENEKLWVNDYKITDKEGNVLINVHQTFEQVSENKFISSILATDNPKDTQIYEMEYTDDGTVKIFDKKNNKTTEIDLNDYADSKETLEMLLSTIKQLPGQVLLKFAEKPFIFLYDAKTKTNAHCINGEILVIGDYDNSIQKDENVFAAVLHELGHYLDLYKSSVGVFSDNPEITTTYEKEAMALNTSATTEQQAYIEYFLNNNQNNKFYTFDTFQRGRPETVAETHSLLYSKEDPMTNMRKFYLAKYLPRTIAAYMKELLKEEGVKV